MRPKSFRADLFGEVPFLLNLDHPIGLIPRNASKGSSMIFGYRLPSLRAAFLPAVIGAFSVTPFHAYEPGTVSGHVKDIGWKPMSGALVEVG